MKRIPERGEILLVPDSAFISKADSHSDRFVTHQTVPTRTCKDTIIKVRRVRRTNGIPTFTHVHWISDRGEEWWCYVCQLEELPQAISKEIKLGGICSQIVEQLLLQDSV